VVDDFVSFIDFAPTFIELAGLDWEATQMQPAAGRSLTDILYSEASGQVNPARDHVIFGKERHDIGRPNDGGYPIRGIVKDGMMYLRNFETDRWPAGNPETGYLATDASPTKTEILEMRRRGEDRTLWEMNFGKRVSEELFDIRQDPACINNLAANLEYSGTKTALEAQLIEELTAQQDPRMFGSGNVFDEYPNATRWAGYYEKFMAGEIEIASWINESDIDNDIE